MTLFDNTGNLLTNTWLTQSTHHMFSFRNCVSTTFLSMSIARGERHPTQSRMDGSNDRISCPLQMTIMHYLSPSIERDMLPLGVIAKSIPPLDVLTGNVIITEEEKSRKVKVAGRWWETREEKTWWEETRRESHVMLIWWRWWWWCVHDHRKNFLHLCEWWVKQRNVSIAIVENVLNCFLSLWWRLLQW